MELNEAEPGGALTPTGLLVRPRRGRTVSDAMPEERWLPVVGYESSHKVSDLGRVRSLDRIVHVTGQSPRRRRGTVLTQHLSPSTGYFTVTLASAGETRTRAVHRLVAEAFLGPCPVGMEVLHGPRRGRDNHLDNLSYGTKRANALDKRRDGTQHELHRTECPRGHALRAPNLVRLTALAGHRQCLACSRAQTTVWNNRQRGVELDFRREADEQFERILRYGARYRCDKTECVRGHALRPPNLVASNLRAGKIACLACSRGRASVQHARTNGIALDVAAEADRHHVAIMQLEAS